MDSEQPPNDHFTPFSDFTPKEDYIFEEFNSKLFQPFIRSERISRCCDFSKQTQVSKDAEDDFESVGQRVMKKMPPKKMVFVPQQAQPTVQYQSYYHMGRKSKLAQAAKRVINYRKCRFKESINIQPNWITVHESQKQNIEKVPLSLIDIKELHQSGTVRQYVTAFDRVKPTHEKPIDVQGGDVIPSSISDDPYLKRLVEQSQGNEEVPTIYTTDKFLFALLTLKYSVYPWDILVTKKGNAIIFDKNPQNSSEITYLELQTINENITVDMPEEEKSIKQYCEESTLASLSWHLMSTSKGRIEFQTEEEKREQALQSDDLGFKYLEVSVKDRVERGPREEPKPGQERFRVIVRTAIEAVDDEGQPVLVKALNECETPANWKQQLKTSAGVIINTAQVYNTNNIAKWLCQANLLESDSIKIGYLARTNPKDFSKHSLLLVESLNQKDLASTINFKPLDCWQNVRYLVEFIKTQEDGTYVLLKAAYRTSFRVFRVSGTLDEYDEEDDQAL